MERSKNILGTRNCYLGLCVLPSINVGTVFLIKCQLSRVSILLADLFARESRIRHVWKLWILFSPCRFMVGCCTLLHSSPSVLCSAFFYYYFFFILPSGKKTFFCLSKPAACPFFFLHGHIKSCTLPIVHCSGVTGDLRTLHILVGSGGSGSPGGFFMAPKMPVHHELCM